MLFDRLPSGVQAHVLPGGSLRFTCRCGLVTHSDAKPLPAALEQLTDAWAEHTCR